MHPNSQQMFVKWGLQWIAPGMKVLEIGPEAVPSTHARLFCERHPDSGVRWEYLDLSNYEGMRRAIGEYEYEIADCEFDVVLAAQVLEHVRKPWLWVKELARCVKLGGTVILICPVTWPYHEFPVDCWRVYPDGMAALFEEAHLRIEIGVSESLDGGVVDTLAVGTKVPLWEELSYERWTT